MTDLEQELLDKPSNIYKKIQEVEEAEIEGNTSIHKAALTKEFFWEKSYRVNVSAEPQYSLSGSLGVGSLKEALAYTEGKDTIYYTDVMWDEDAEMAFDEIDALEVEVEIDDFKLKNPSKDYQAILQDKEEKDARQEIIGALKRCLKSSGANPDDFHILVDEVKEIWEV